MIVIRSDNDIGYTIGNETKLEQVFLNLFSNSKHALLEKESGLTTGTFSKRIEINIKKMSFSRRV